MWKNIDKEFSQDKKGVGHYHSGAGCPSRND